MSERVGIRRRLQARGLGRLVTAEHRKIDVVVERAAAGLSDLVFPQVFAGIPEAFNGDYGSISQLASLTLHNRGSSVPNDEFYSMYRRIISPSGKRTLLKAVSPVVDVPDQVATVKKLLHLNGTPTDELDSVTAYRYARIVRQPLDSLLPTAIPDDGYPEEEYYLAGLKKVASGFCAVAVLSFDESSLGLLNLSDATARDPLVGDFPEPRPDAFAAERVYRLVASDAPRLQAAA